MARKNTVKKKSPQKIENSTSKTKIRVVGVGGGGASIISEISSTLAKVDFVAANTDKRSIKSLPKKVRGFAFGEKLTGGFGTGMDYEIGKNAAIEEKDRIQKIFQGQDVCILVSSLGGGTGSGAVPIFAKEAKEAGCIVYGIFTLPFEFEGNRKMEIAKNALEETKSHLNAITVLPNENIFKIIDKDAPLKEALSMINNNLSESLRGLIEAIYSPGLINIDFADFKTVLNGRGKLAYLNTVVIDSQKGIDDVIKEVTNNPFYPYGIKGASGVLLNITGSKNIGLKDVSQVSKNIFELVKKNATIIFGITHEEKHGDKIKVMILAVGCESEDKPPKQEKKKPLIKKREVKVEKKVKKKKRPKAKKEEKKPQESKVDVKVRRTALDVKKVTEDAEKEILEEEKKWETPAFLRRKDNS